MTLLKRLINAIRVAFTIPEPQNLTAEQIDALNKRTIVLTFCVALLICIVTVCYCASYVENPLFHIAKADQYNYETIKITITQIFSALAIILGAKALAPYTPSAMPQTPQVVNSTAPVVNSTPPVVNSIQPATIHKKLDDDDA